jgi:hypothetical protein
MKKFVFNFMLRRAGCILWRDGTGIVLIFKNKISQVLAIENLVLDPDPTLDYPNSLDPNSDLKSKDPKNWFPVPYCLLGFND